MADKFLKIGSNGFQTEQEFATTSAGAADAGKGIGLNGAGKIDETLLPSGIGADAATLTAGENLAAGDFVYVTGTGTVMKADATALAKAAVGYVNAAVTSGQPATVFFDDTNSNQTGLTAGTKYFLSDTVPGKVSATPPTTAGRIVQYLGIATSTTDIHVSIQQPIVRA